ncbi:carbohydrate kinase [Sulfurovum lithotrophicum]|uniref:Bifunctional NAD(P)H-hydrate repair enzyme n=1 Tax=Sulfurovum lithotrophicum TaxID=206403 RepID=A0A7U4RPY6_9BACT|nr:bifunctional ADP-dependent NAD(P)H-hydrate dehydratase/NAD(P)H-hydrate epimerase [Sulfurovum lithotrophicum]AKF24191.1 carbohydrate kinase [Sulfurovum lithotrophicum]
MQKVFKSCYELDRRCYERYGLTEDILMEHAAGGMAAYIQEHFEAGSSVLIVSGVGNNGVDGIVLARQLHGSYDIRLAVPFGVKSEMAKLQLQRAQAAGVYLTEEMQDADVIVDAVFGAGLSREIDEKTQFIVHRLNSFRGHRIACDIPTGLGEEGRLMPMAFKADVTVTMGAYKEALYLDEGKDYVGKIIRVDLGVSTVQYETGSCTFLLEESDLKLPSRRVETAHKGTFGHAAVFCGEKEGAGIIAGTAASRFGAGLTTLVVHEKISPPPYLMHSTVVPGTASAIAVGMGLGEHFEQEFLQQYLIDSHLPVVLDADSFHHSEILLILKQKERDIVVTPHPKEFSAMWEHLTGECLSVEEIQKNRFETVRRFNACYPHVTLLLKGANMLIMQEERLYINPMGNAKLSKGGSGDVLSGLIVSLLAQGYPGVEAAIQASLALVLSAGKYEGASYAMLPTDIIEGLPLLEGS